MSDASYRPRRSSWTIIGVLFVIVACGSLGFGVWYFARDGNVVDLLVVMASAAMAGTGGVALLGGRIWGRWLLIAWMAFHVVVSVFHSTSVLLIHLAIFTPITFFLLRHPAPRETEGA